jgi:hypothetical protein
MITLTKKSKIYLSLFSLSLISVIYIYSSLQKKTPPAITSPLPQIQTTNPLIKNIPLTTVTFDPNTPFPEFPITLSTYTGDSNLLDITVVAQHMADYYKLKVTDNPVIWTNSQKTMTMTIPPKKTPLNLGFDSFTVPALFKGKNRPITTTAVANSSKFITAYDFWENLTPQISDIKYFTASTGQYISVPMESASLIQIPFTQTLNNYPLYYSNSDLPQITVLAGQNSQIVKIDATLQNISVNPTSVHTYYTLTRDQVVSQIQSNNIQVLSGPDDYVISSNLKSFPPITINQISLEYRFDPQSKLIAPYFRLSGLVSPQKDVVVPMTLIMSAVNLTP